MTEGQVREILRKHLRKESEGIYKPTNEDWDALRKKFKCEFPDSFRSFLNLMSEYCFEGDILNIIDHEGNNGNDTIALTYDSLIKDGVWNEQMIPFFFIGNGDYFCLSSSESENTSVYYFYHEDGSYEKEYESFEEWLEDIEEFA